MPVVDTEFLFGMRANDKKHALVKKILESRHEIQIPSLAVFEVMVVCLSEGKGSAVAIETLDLIQHVINQHNLRIIPFDVGQLMSGLKIYGGGIGLFDALIAGVALMHDETVLGDDDDFLGIGGLKRVTLKEYAKI